MVTKPGAFYSYHMKGWFTNFGWSLVNKRKKLEYLKLLVQQRFCTGYIELSIALGILFSPYQNIRKMVIIAGLTDVDTTSWSLCNQDSHIHKHSYRLPFIMIDLKDCFFFVLLLYPPRIMKSLLFLYPYLKIRDLYRDINGKFFSKEWWTPLPCVTNVLQMPAASVAKIPLSL